MRAARLPSDLAPWIAPHNNMAELEQHLQATQHLRHRIIVTDGVFSMEGSIADLPAMRKLCDEYGAILVVDDSAFMRRAIPMLLSREAGFEVVGTAQDGKDALAKIGKKGTFIQGMRVTDEETMEVVEWVLAGQVQQPPTPDAQPAHRAVERSARGGEGGDRQPARRALPVP